MSLKRGEDVVLAMLIMCLLAVHDFMLMLFIDRINETILDFAPFQVPSMMYYYTATALTHPNNSISSSFTSASSADLLRTKTTSLFVVMRRSKQFTETHIDEIFTL